MRLYYYPEGFIVPYTRIAKELSIGKTTIKDSWKRLKKNGYIIEQGDYYIINLNGTGNDPNNIGTASGHKQTQGTGNDHKDNSTASGHEYNKGTSDDPIEVQQMDVPESASDHRLVRDTTLIGTPDDPNEEDTKEEDILNKTKEEPSVVGGCGVGSDSATTPDGVAPSSPPQPQLRDEKNITVSKYARNENERLILLTGYKDYLNHNPDSGLVFNSYEDLLVLVVYGYESHTNKWIITKWEEVVNLLNSDSNIKLYNTYINSYGVGLLDNTENSQQVFKQLKQSLIDSNK